MKKIILGFLALLPLVNDVKAYEPVGIDHSIDLRKEYPQIFNHLKVMNQGSFGTCYLYSAYISAEFFRKKALLREGKTVGASSLSIPELAVVNYKSDISVDGGHPADVIRGLNKQTWMCDQETLSPKLEHELFSYMNHNDASVTYVDLYHRANKNNHLSLANLTAEDWSHLHGLYNVDKVKRLKQSEVLAPFTTHASLNEFKHIVSASFADHSYHEGLLKKFLRSRFTAMCGENHRIKAPHLKIEQHVVNHHNREENLNRIWNYFAGKEIGPVSISGCISALTQGGICAANTDDAHAMSIIGRRMYWGARQFLVRNSWGKTNIGLPDPNAQGEAWVSEAMLHGFLTEVVFFREH